MCLILTEHEYYEDSCPMAEHSEVKCMYYYIVDYYYFFFFKFGI